MRFHNFNERNVYDIITEHQSTEHKYNIETLNEFLQFKFLILAFQMILIT